ncbi:hypothetical protein [Oceanibium sediminis]|uniref:hypothetical protein n=1 Tax=Oceanibium sediminis TaxID=2026339 RepID=UPI001300491C|nr:hypothetical protein [Oceanibium sediminis]
MRMNDHLRVALGLGAEPYIDRDHVLHQPDHRLTGEGDEGRVVVERGVHRDGPAGAKRTSPQRGNVRHDAKDIHVSPDRVQKLGPADDRFLQEFLMRTCTHAPPKVKTQRGFSPFARLPHKVPDRA